MKFLKKLSCTLILASSTVMAADINIGVVDLQRVMQNAPQMKEIQQKLEARFQARRDKLLSLESEIKKDMDKIKRDVATLSANQKKDLEKKLLTKQQTFERDGQQYQQELNAAHNEALEELYAKIRAAITKIAEKEKYELILQKDAAPYSSEKLDITNNILKQIS